MSKEKICPQMTEIKSTITCSSCTKKYFLYLKSQNKLSPTHPPTNLTNTAFMIVCDRKQPRKPILKWYTPISKVQSKNMFEIHIQPS